MVSNIGSSSHFIQAISSTYPRDKAVPQYEPLEIGAPRVEPPPLEEKGASPPIDPLAAADFVDTNDDRSLSEDEYIALKAMLSQAAGDVYPRNLSDSNPGPDDQFNSEELKSVPGSRGFQRLPASPHTVISAYQAQQGNMVHPGAGTGLEDLLDGLKTRGGRN